MDFMDFKQYYLGRLFNHNETQSNWVQIKKNVDCGTRCFNNWYKKTNLHPIIQKGLGFWETDSVIVMGYKLRGHDDIICPIYSHKRNKLLNGVLNTIKDRIGNSSDSGYGGGKFMVCLRQNMVKCALLGVRFSDDGNIYLPTDVINLIGSYCA